MTEFISQGRQVHPRAEAKTCISPTKNLNDDHKIVRPRDKRSSDHVAHGTDSDAHEVVKMRVSESVKSNRSTPNIKASKQSHHSTEASTDIIDVEDISSIGGESISRARTAILERIRTAAGLGGPAASATVQEFHRYLGRLRGEEDGPFQCLVAALLRSETHSLQCIRLRPNFSRKLLSKATSPSRRCNTPFAVRCVPLRA